MGIDDDFREHKFVRFAADEPGLGQVDSPQLNLVKPSIMQFDAVEVASGNYDAPQPKLT